MNENTSDTINFKDWNTAQVFQHIVVTGTDGKSVVISDPDWETNYPECVDIATKHIQDAFLELEALGNDLVNSFIQPYRYMFLTGSPQRAVEFVGIIENLVGLVDHPELSRPVTQILMCHGIKFEQRDV